MFNRSVKNPILKPIDYHPWESKKVYNAGAIYENNEFHLFYRAVGSDWRSSIGYAYSFDGENFIRFDKPLIEPTSPKEKNGIEDPRITKIGNNYFMTYTAYEGLTARLCLAISTDMMKWKKQDTMLQGWNYEKAGGFNITWDAARNKPETKKDWSKAGAIFPELIDEKYWMLFGDSNIWLAHSKNGLSWKAVSEPLIKPRKGDNFFDSKHLEMGPPPIKTKDGWLILYHGINQNRVYRIGYLLLDLNDPKNILTRSEKPLFEPSTDYELNNLTDIMPGFQVMSDILSNQEKNELLGHNKSILPKVIFCCGAIIHDNLLRIYYGAGDSSICTATANLNQILPNNKLNK